MEISMMIFLLYTRVTPPIITPVNQLSILVRLQSRVRSSGTTVDGLNGFLFFYGGWGGTKIWVFYGGWGWKH